MMTAVSASSGETNARRNSVVFPLPRKPVSKVVGRVSGSGTLFTTRQAAIPLRIVSRGGRGGKLCRQTRVITAQARGPRLRRRLHSLACLSSMPAIRGRHGERTLEGQGK